MSWEIKSKNNEVKFEVGKVEYNDEWMQERYVTVTIESPAPINFQIGDYLIYRGERFEINYDPGKIKSAEAYDKGDAFRYENVKFNSLADELTRCDFLDVVLNDNQLHFTGLPKFSFYGGVKTLADRIQANLDRAYPGMWTVECLSNGAGGSDTGTNSDIELNVAVDTIKVSGALEILVNQFKTYYTIKGRTLTIGAAGVPADHLFKYGKGNGLYEIEENAEADQQIVTRLRAYGSTRNIPHRYYNSLTDADGVKLIPDNMAVQYLMLPSFPYTTQDPYINSKNIDALGVREGTIFFDGSGELEEIYPSIEGMTAEQLKAAGVPCNAEGALDVLVSAEQMTDNGVGKIEGDAFEGNATTTAEPETFKVTIKDVGFDINDHIIEGNSESPTLSFKSGMLGGRDFEIVECKKEGNNYVLELNRVYDEDIKLWFPYKDYNAKKDDKFVLLNIRMPEVYIKAASQRLLEAAEKWLAKNDYSRSIYAPKIDENFMARQHDAAMASGGTIKSLHDTLCAGMQLLFEDEDLGIDAAIFIDRLTIIEGEGSIPTYEVVLKEEKTVGRLDKMQNQIDSLAAGQGQGSGGYNASQIRSLINAYGGQLFLSKLKDDRSAGKVASDKGFEVGDFLAGVSGAMIGIDAQDGESFAEVGRLWVRVKAYFESLTIIDAQTLAGKQYITPGGSVKITSVEEVFTSDKPASLRGWRCYFLSEQDGEKTETKMIVGDQAISEMFNAKAGTSNKISNHRYWRLVTGVSNDAYEENGNHYGYIELSASNCEADSDVPEEGDVLCQLGYQGTNNAERQTAMVFSTVDADAPSIKMYSGINSYSLNDKAIISFGRDPLTSKVYFRLGNSSAKQYLDYTQDGGLKLAGEFSILANSQIGGKSVADYILDIAPDAYDDTELRDKVDDAQSSADTAQSTADSALSAAGDAQQTADNAQTAAQQAKDAADSYKYLKESLLDATKGSTQISGGLILSRMMALGYTDNADMFHILSGMNGAYNDSLGVKTPFLWGGGTMIDLFNPDGTKKTGLTDYAKAMIRMDGSSYFGGGAHAFNADGTGWLGDKDNGIKFDALGRITVGSGVTININNEDKGIKETIESVLNFQLGFENLLTPCDANGNPISWAEATQSDGAGGIKAKSLKANVGLWSESFVSARGRNPWQNSGPVGSTSLSGLDDVALSNLASGQSLVYNGTEWVNQTIQQGLNTTELANYLTTNNYAKTADIQQWVEDKNYLTDHQDIYKLTFQSGVFSAKTYTPNSSAQTVNIPTTTSHISEGANLYFTDARAQSALASTVSALNTAIGTKLPTATFDTFKSGYDSWKSDVDAFIAEFGSMFDKEADSSLPKGYRIKALFGLYTDEFLSARGMNGNSGGGAIGNRLDSWSAYVSGNGDVLSADLGYELKQRIDNLPTTSVNPYALTIQKNGTALGTYDGSSALTINISDVASASALSTHTSNTTIHITATERTLWNQTATNLSAILGSDASGVIDKWDEIVAFLATYTEADTLAGLLSNKADKTTKISAGTGLSGGGDLTANRTLSLATSGVTAGTYFKTTVDAYGRVTAGSNPTTLAGYGITDAYTKTEAEGAFVKKSGDTMTGTLKITNGYLNINGSYITGLDNGGFQFMPKNSLTAEMSKNGFYPIVTMFLGTTTNRWHRLYANSVDVSEKIKIGDGEIIWDAEKGGFKFTHGIYSEEWISARGANASAGGGSLGLDESQLADYLTDHGYATQTWVNTQGFLKSVAWADVTGKPTTLAGYGITDAKIANGVITLGGNSITPLTSHQSLSGYATQSWVQSQGYLTGHQSLSNYVTLNTAQTISAKKTFTGGIAFNQGVSENTAMPFFLGIKAFSDGGDLQWITASKVCAAIGAATASSLANYVTLDGAQTISGVKTYTNGFKLKTDTSWSNSDRTIPFGLNGDSSTIAWYYDNADKGLTFNPSTGALKAGSFVKRGGTSSQFLKADGSVDSNSYALASSLGSYLPLSGGTLKNGTSIVPLQIDTDSADEIGLRFKMSGTFKGWLGYHPTYGTNLYNYTAKTYLGLRDNGNAYVGNNLVLTSANIGSYAITSHQSLANYVDRTTAQTIGGNKTFTGCSRVEMALMFKESSTTKGLYFTPNTEGGLAICRHESYAWKSTPIIIDYNGAIHSYLTTTSYLAGNKGTAIISSDATGGKGRYTMLAKMNSTNGVMTFGTYESRLEFHYTANTLINEAKNTISWGITLLDEDGNSTFNKIIKSGGTSSQFLKADGSVDGTAYLPLTGGTLNGGSDTPLYLNSNTTNTCYLGLKASGTILGYYGANANGPIWYKSGANTIWHSGNDGAGSGLDADLLDGVHNGDLTAKYLVAINDATTDLNTLGAKSDKITYYYAGGGSTNANRPTTAHPFGVFNLRVADGYMAQLAIQYGRLYARYYDSSTWGAWNTLALTTDNVASATRLQGSYSLWGQTFYGNNVSGNMTGVGTISRSGTEAPYLLAASTPANAGALGTAVGIGIAPLSYGMFFWGEGTGKGHIQVGRKDGTATAYNLILQEFGGNVGIGTTAPAYKLDVNGTSRFSNTMIVAVPDSCANYNQGIRLYGSATDSTWSLICFGCDITKASGTHSNQWLVGRSENNAFVIDKGGSTGANGIIITADLKVGIGKTNPSYKLDVNGEIRASGWLRQTGIAGWYNETYAGGWYMNDTTWIKTYNQKSIYSGTGTIRTDGALQVGANGATFIATNGGNVGINNTDPTYALDVTGDIRASANLRSNYLYSGGIELNAHNTPYIDFHCNKTTADYDVRLINQTSGELKCVGTFRATVGMWSDGYVSARGQNTSSDARLKQNLNAFEIALHQIANAPSVAFNWKNGGHDVGSIAQYWQGVNPLLTPKAPNGYLTLQYGKTALLASISIAKKVISHEERIAQLERENKELKRKIEILERR
ncbi:MAG: hypothetical protein K2N48_01280 [Muribaculaceae bacterium]|nr:hypothetical protein [Muribaculaceae bacterium]